MTTRILLLLLLTSAALSAAADAPQAADDALQAVAYLGQANGQALACGDQAAAARAKELMLKHAPRTARYGSAFEQATQEGYLSQIKGRSPCPSAAEMAVRVESLSMLLRETLPAGE